LNADRAPRLKANVRRVLPYLKENLMHPRHAAHVIESIVDSLKSNPNQFQFNVHVSATGMTATSHGGGVGAIGIAQGGGTGIRASASMDDAQIQIAQRKADTAINEQYQSLLNALTEIAHELKTESPDESKIKRIYESLKGKWVPGVITSVVGNLITYAFLS
jgi:hypothetical protein